MIIRESDLDYLKKLQAPSVGEKADRLLLHLAQECSKAGALIDLNLTANGNIPDEQCDYTVGTPEYLVALTWSQDSEELLFVIDEYLVKEAGYLAEDKNGFYTISPKGWMHLDRMRTQTLTTSSAFVAMWFDPSMDLMFGAVARAITNSGYRPLRIDQQEHNNRIDDEILAAIRRSKFVVADFTKQRGGVYFEAGFGLGLGLRVIWLCRRDHLKKVHFDNRQYNFILWTDDKLGELESALRNRIEATIGRGPLKSLDEP